MKIFAIHDLKSGLYEHFMILKTTAEALRSFEMALRDEKSLLSVYREDFELVCVATVCAETGIVEANLHVVAKGSEYKKDLLGEKE